MTRELYRTPGSFSSYVTTRMCVVVHVAHCMCNCNFLVHIHMFTCILEAKINLVFAHFIGLDMCKTRHVVNLAYSAKRVISVSISFGYKQLLVIMLKWHFMQCSHLVHIRAALIFKASSFSFVV